MESKSAVLKAILVLTVAATLLTFAPGGFAKDTGRCKPSEGDQAAPQSAQVFFAEMKAAAAKNDRQSLASMVAYPLTVSTASRRFKVRSPEQFRKEYERIFTEELRDLLLDQQPDCVGRIGAQGFTIHDGEIWFDEYPDGKYRIFTITPVVLR